MAKVDSNVVLTVSEPGKVKMTQRPYPNVKPGAILVKTEIAAVCVDERIFTHHVHERFENPQFGCGHESVGTVVEAPESHVFKPGDRVLISHGAYCGRCFACLNRLSPAHCASLSDGVRAHPGTATPEFFFNGLAPVERNNESQSGWAAIAEYRLADEGTCTLLPQNLDFRYAIAAECSVGVAYCAQEFMDVSAGDHLLLVGSGQRQFSFSHVIVGLFRGARVMVVAPDDFHMDIVRRIGKARGGTPDLHILDLNHPDWSNTVLELTDGIGPDQIADFTSDERMHGLEFDLIRHDGVLYIQKDLRVSRRVSGFDPYTSIARKNLKIVGTTHSRRQDLPGIIRTLQNEEVQRMWDVVVTHEFPMTQAEEAFRISATQRCGKILIYPHGLPEEGEHG